MTVAPNEPTDATIRARLDALAKPPGSLGRLEELARALARCQGTLRPRTRPAHLVLFAADHGVAAAGVTAWPQAVTTAMLRTIRTGGAVSSALARTHGVALSLVDVGTRAETGRASGAGEAPALPPVRFVDARVAPGTADLSRGAAMTLPEFERAWAAGVAEAEHAAAAGAALLIAGEMGIGNTTSASALTVLLTGCALDEAIGPGASPDGSRDAIVTRKREVVAAALARARRAASPVDDPRAALAALAGFELVAMAGLYARGAALGLTLLLDGFVATAAALLAERLHPGARRRMLAAHRSAEPGHRVALAALALDPVLDWGMRLGEGSGALVALPLLDSAAALLTDVASLSDVLRGGDAA